MQGKEESGLRDRSLVVFGVGLLVVVLAWYVAFYAQVFSHTFVFPSAPYVALSFFIPEVPIELLVLIIGFALQRSLDAPRSVFLAFVLVEIASIAMTLVDGAITTLRIFTAAPETTNTFTVYLPSLGWQLLQPIGIFLLLLMVRPWRLSPAPPASMDGSSSAPPPQAP